MAEETMEMPDGMAVEACLDEHAYVYVAFRGACAGCMMATEDFSSGIKLLLMDEVPGIRDVILVG